MREAAESKIRVNNDQSELRRELEGPKIIGGGLRVVHMRLRCAG